MDFVEDVRVTSRMVGTPLFIGGQSGNPLKPHGFSIDKVEPHEIGVQYSLTEYECSQSAELAADGSLAGATPTPVHTYSQEPSNVGFVDESNLDRPGSWTCVGRASAVDDRDQDVHHTPWTDPITTFVREYFFPGGFTFVDRRGPSYSAVAKLPDGLADGGKLSVRVRRYKGDHARGKSRAGHGSVKGGKVRVGFKVAQHPRCWQVSMKFAGTELVAPGRTKFVAAFSHNRPIAPTPGACG
jgi:hypothetical protein